MACCKCAGHIFTDHFHTGAAKQILLVALTLGLPTHTAGFTISKWHTYNQTRNKFGQTDIQTYIQCSSWAGVAFRRHCHGHASPSSTTSKAPRGGGKLNGFHNLTASLRSAEGASLRSAGARFARLGLASLSPGARFARLGCSYATSRTGTSYSK